MNLSDLKAGDRFVVAGVTSVFTCTGFRTARTDDGELTVWTYDAECDLYEEDAPYDPPDGWRLPE